MNRGNAEGRFASAGSTSVQLVSTGSGLGVNYAVSVSIADTQTASYPTLFSSPSFTANAANMSGGAAADASYGTIYSYLVPGGGYAPNGNILTHTDSVMGTWSFNYDAVDRLTSAASGSNAPSAFQGQNAGWSYDSYGNRTAQAFSNGANSNWATYNSANNQITSVNNDAVVRSSYAAEPRIGNTLPPLWVRSRKSAQSCIILARGSR
jgi:YD repeat-containing protein